MGLVLRCKIRRNLSFVVVGLRARESWRAFQNVKGDKGNWEKKKEGGIWQATKGSTSLAGAIGAPVENTRKQEQAAARDDRKEREKCGAKKRQPMRCGSPKLLSKALVSWRFFWDVWGCCRYLRKSAPHSGTTAQKARYYVVRSAGKELP